MQEFFARAALPPTAAIEALDWGCTLRVAQTFAQAPAHVAIRAHHVRVRPAGKFDDATRRENIFPCRLVAMTETPFRVTLDLRIIGNIGGPAESERASAAEFQIQAEVFKQEWDSFRDLPQPWLVELSPERVFLLPD